MTLRDWRLINEALALYQASTTDMNLTPSAQAKLEDRIAAVRAKVWERLDQRSP